LFDQFDYALPEKTVNITFTFGALVENGFEKLKSRFAYLAPLVFKVFKLRWRACN
jgi:hypothetical protein